ncbi:hypothetical protein ABOZ73_07320 [Caulobacter sp. 73W]|uniref:Uncharacterized protein n=1 Tax=Caulobacter sp. 73W TaxID=3161137 RepID=A0AB39KXU1_9CAUL
MLKRVLGWLGGKAALYAALVAAILASAFVVPWLQSQWRDPARQLASAKRLETQVVAPLATQRVLAQQRLDAIGADARTKSLAQLDLALAEARQEKAAAEGRRRSISDKAVSLASGRTDALLQDGRTELEIQLRDAEIAGLSAARERIIKGDALAALSLDLDDARQAADQARSTCRAARLELEAAQARWQVKATLGLYDRDRLGDLTQRREELCARSRAADQRQLAAQGLQDAAAKSYAAARGWTDARIGPVTAEVETWIARERVGAEGTWGQKLSLWAERVHLPDALRRAAAALAVIIAAPYLIRLFCYFVLAPVAMRRPRIRIGGDDASSVVIPMAERSAASVSVRLAGGEELVVRHGFLQSTSDAGAKATQWLLDASHPITSIAAGLTFLTRIRGEGEVTGVSAVRDPFSEVTVLTLPPGASCVLQPRALAAVVKPIGQRLRVTAHWRLLSLNAWLTMQLRFLVFHGPARLVLQGGRGVRVERAERGRILGQDQVVGFSTDLAYSVTRTETFWPYFFGREPLLKDRVAAGDGVLIVEEAPMAGRHGDQVRRGVEGAVDALMKVFGL